MTKQNTFKSIQVESIRIGLASPDCIRKWAERTLPNGKIIGKVTSRETVNYKTFKPEKDGLFCERIFGPVTNLECSCGRKKTEPEQQFCTECDVEFTTSRVRRYRLGYIELISPVVHIWYLKGRLSYISILLDMRRKNVEAITYCTSIIDNMYDETEKSIHSETDNSKKILKKQLQKTFLNNYYTVSQTCSWKTQSDLDKFSCYMTCLPQCEDIPIPSYSNRINNKFIFSNNVYLNTTQLSTVLTGPEAIRYFLANLDLQLLDRQIKVELFELNEEIHAFENIGFLFFDERRLLQKLLYIRSKKLRRLKLVKNFRRSKTKPEWMVLSNLPVLPPDLRPIIQLDGDQIAVSDLNKLYQKVIGRNKVVERYRFMNISNKSDEMKFALRAVQEAVDALIENGKSGATPICAPNDRPLKSLSDMLKGKKGRFRQNLLGKRVDYSGRSVIVVGPELKIHECGLPKEMALELFQPFLIRQLKKYKFADTIVGAKLLIQRQDPIIWEVLQRVVQNHPVLLNRAPTLHRLGIQAFQPKLVDGRAILLHPLVCPSFNADFDGDQMAVHVPLSFQARAEAWKLMWSRNNVLSPATGQPILIPSQDMVLGCYYLTTTNIKFMKGVGKYFHDLTSVLRTYNQKKISLHAPIWVRWEGFIEIGNFREKPLEIRVDVFGNTIQIYSKCQRHFNKTSKQNSQFIRTTAGRVLVNQTILFEKN
uniref:DNA-directed RNA polymerase subunit beta' n=1 Tax=Edaphochlorella mirabilis TaxID=3083 RepID=A0A097KKP9_9CHLO|nr:beta' subunit of RNA polymerase [Edaphochlorella mirabilis]AIT93775.1 beta' subunit of RNA polymerase [Edaphochlorella mirabilis]